MPLNRNSVFTVPTVVSDLVELQSHGNELGKIDIVVGIIDGEEAGGFGGQSDHVLPVERVLERFGL